MAELPLDVDVANPGQFFACCGILELADRLWSGAEGRFDLHRKEFHIQTDGTLADLLVAVAEVKLQVIRPGSKETPLLLGSPFRPLRIDWWETDKSARDFKTWAGSMDNAGIARAMQGALRDPALHNRQLLNHGMAVSDADQPKKKKEPFYFDSRRAVNAHARDIGFSPNTLNMKTIAHPAVELLCLIGLQRSRPTPTGRLRTYRYHVWPQFLPASLLTAATTGRLELPGVAAYEFENWFRTGQKKHKTFRPATRIA